MTEARSDFESSVRGYDTFFPQHVTNYYTKFRKDYVRAALPNGGSVLDVGCGTGLLANSIAEDEKFRVTGIDPSAEMLAQAPAGRATLVKAGADALPFPDSQFDLVLSAATFHHFVKPEIVTGGVREMVRVCKPGGRIVIWDLNGLNPMLKPLMRRVPWDRDTRVVSIREFRQAFAAAGIPRIDVRFTGWVPQFTPAALMPVVIAIERVLERIPLINRMSANIVMSVSKPGV